MATLFTLRYSLEHPHVAEAIGRSGAFRPKRLLAELVEDHGRRLVRFWLFSRREGEEAPIQFTLDWRDWRRYSLALAEASQQAADRQRFTELPLEDELAGT